LTGLPGVSSSFLISRISITPLFMFMLCTSTALAAPLLALSKVIGSLTSRVI
jgi:hypothetical protein